jgi:hypothetical protein
MGPYGARQASTDRVVSMAEPDIRSSFGLASVPEPEGFCKLRHPSEIRRIVGPQSRKLENTKC